MNGQDYPSSLVFGVYSNDYGVRQGYTAWVSYDLGRKCSVFETTAGISSNSRDTLWTFHPYVAIDDQPVETDMNGTPIAGSTVGMYNTVPLRVDITGALRLTVGVTMGSNPNNASGIFGAILGSARVWCER